eukprot:Skav225297  [mRNA]  locus=scaffold4099:493490:495811:- [translate_table: standard]
MSASFLEGEGSPSLSPADEPEGLKVDLFGEECPFPPDMGPMSRDQMWRWQCFALDRLDKAGLMKNVLHKFGCGIDLRTDYSGLGTAETALSFIHTALGRLGHRVEAGAVTASAAGIFGDILDRAPQKGLARVKALQEEYRKRRDLQCRKARLPYAQVVARLGREFMREAWQILEEAEHQEAVSDLAYCYRHQGYCMLPRSSDMSFDVKMDGAGPSCFDFSGLGNTEGWLGESAIPFLVYLRERMRRPVHVVTLENVDNFDDPLVGELVAPTYILKVLSVDPVMFGLPSTRSRKYMLLLRKGFVQWAPEVAKDPETAFRILFCRPVPLDGSVFFSAPASYVESFHKVWAKQKGKCRDLAQLARDELRFYVMNVTQTAARSPCVSLIPALIQNSTLFSMQHQRTMTLPEMLEVQGFPIFVPPDCPYVCPFQKELVGDDFEYKPPPANLRSMIGNSMHFQAIGHVLLFFLGCTVLADPEPVIPFRAIPRPLGVRQIRNQTVDLDSSDDDVIEDEVLDAPLSDSQVQLEPGHNAVSI